MKVYAFTSDKEVIETSRPEWDVVEQGINPFTVDLFALSPIANGPGLPSFNRLGEVSFGVMDFVTRQCKGAYSDGHSHFCFTGQVQGEQLNVRTLKPLAVDFQTLLLRYLSLHEGARAQNNECCLFFSCGRKVVLENSGLTFVADSQLDRPQVGFAGRMFDRLPVLTRLPQSINRVFSDFAQWKPMVFGGCLRDTICGAAFKDVDFMVESPNGRFDFTLLEKLGATDVEDITGAYMDNGHDDGIVMSFQLEGVLYNLVTRTESTRNFWEINDFSVNQMYALAPDQVVASRIALADLAKSQFRIVSTLRPHKGDRLYRRWARRTHMLGQRGLQFIDTPFVPVTPDASDETDIDNEEQ